MDKFSMGTTVICSLEVYKDGVLYDPYTSMKITVTDKFEVKKINGELMLKAGTPVTGEYHYDCDTTGWVDGKFRVDYTATDNPRVSSEIYYFGLE